MKERRMQKERQRETGKRETGKRVKDREEREWTRKNIEYNVSSREAKTLLHSKISIGTFTEGFIKNA